MSEFPFLFLGHGEGPAKTYDACVVAADPSAALELEGPLAAWATRYGLAFEPLSSPAVIVFHTAGRSSARAADSAVELERLLRAQHARVPLGLVARRNRVTPSAWHRWSMHRATELLALLERYAERPGPYNEPALRGMKGGTERAHRSEGIHRGLLEDVQQEHPVGAWMAMAFELLRGSKERAARAVWADLVQERLPPLLGKRFAIDLVLVDELARALDISRGSVETPPQFKRAMTEAYASINRPSPEGTYDWSKPGAISAALAGRLSTARWSDLESSLEETNPAHQRTMLELSHEQRLSLLGHGALTTRMANVANYFVMRGEFREALTIYDSVIEAKRLHPLVCTSLLYAACVENNKLPPDDARARRYLAACLRYGDENPLIYLNSSGLFGELGDAERCLEMLARAKAKRVKIKEYRNDRAYDLVRQHPEFKRLMR